MILVQATGADCGRLLTAAIVGTALPAEAASGKPAWSSTGSVVVAICP